MPDPRSAFISTISISGIKALNGIQCSVDLCCCNLSDYIKLSVSDKSPAAINYVITKHLQQLHTMSQCVPVQSVISSCCTVLIAASHGRTVRLTWPQQPATQQYSSRVTRKLNVKTHCHYHYQLGQQHLLAQHTLTSAVNRSLHYTEQQQWLYCMNKFTCWGWRTLWHLVTEWSRLRHWRWLRTWSCWSTASVRMLNWCWRLII